MGGGRGRGAWLGGLSGLLLGLIETLCRYLPTLANVDLLPVPGPVLAATVLYTALGAAAGAVWRPLGPLALIGIAAASADLDPLGFAAAPAAAALAWVCARRPRLAWSLPIAAALGLLLLPREQVGVIPGSPARPDIVLVVLDTVAARDTSLHGAPYETTPTLEALAAEGVHWRQAVASGPWTVPSHASLFTGLPARSVGAHHEHPGLATDRPTTAERLRDAGYRTGSFVANSWLAPSTELTRGFAHREQAWALDARHTSFAALRLVRRLLPPRDKGGETLVERALAWLDRAGDQPSFAFLNLLEAHSPYHEVPEPGRFGAEHAEALGARIHAIQSHGPGAEPPLQDDELEAARALYAAAVAAADDLLAALVVGLRERGRLERTLLVVTSDHGEAFGEHGFTGHVVGLYEETLHVPLVMRHPRLTHGGREVAEPVAQERVHDTLVEVGTGEPQLRSLLGEGALREPVAISEQRRPIRSLARYRSHLDRGDLSHWDFRALRVREGSLVLLRETPAGGGPARFALFDLARDPEERRPLWPDPRAAALLERMARFDELEVRGKGELYFEGAFRERLEALGYLEAAPEPEREAR